MGSWPDGSSADGGGWWGDAPLRVVLGQVASAAGAAVYVGVLLGLVWRWLAPPIEIVVGAGSTAEQVDRVFATEGVYAAIMAGAGLVSAILARRWLRQAGPLAVVGVVVAGIVGSIVAWRVGVWAGPDRLTTTDGVPDGTVLTDALGLHSHGLLLAWSITAVFTLLWVAALSPDPAAQRATDPVDGTASAAHASGGAAALGAEPVHGSAPALATDADQAARPSSR